MVKEVLMPTLVSQGTILEKISSITAHKKNFWVFIDILAGVVYIVNLRAINCDRLHSILFPSSSLTLDTKQCFQDNYSYCMSSCTQQSFNHLYFSLRKMDFFVHRNWRCLCHFPSLLSLTLMILITINAAISKLATQRDSSEINRALFRCLLNI